MSDTAQGPGWWQASDGRWYPPDQVPAGSPPIDQTQAYGQQAPPAWGGQQAPPARGDQAPGWGNQPPPQAWGNQPAWGPPGYAYGYPPGRLPSNGIGTAAMVLGIIALVLFWFPGVSWILALLAVVFGGVGISKANRHEADNKGMGIAGLVCGGLVIAFWVVIFVVAASSN